MPRKATGTLILKKSGYVARYWATVDGERIRVTIPLGTNNRAVARKKLDRLVAAEDVPTEAEAKRVETYDEAAERIREGREAEGVADVVNEESRHRRHISALIGSFPVTDLTPEHVRSVLLAGKEKGLSQTTLRHLRSDMRLVLDALWRDGIVKENAVLKVKAPRGKVDSRERAILTDAELGAYLAWEHPVEKHRGAVRERQTMSCVSRMFGGVRTGDLHGMRWEALDPGRFEIGLAPRRKTKSPQKLIIPAVLRPILRDWWERQGRPMTGLVFPVRRGERAGTGEKERMSHAKALRRDLRRAFGIEVPQTREIERKNGRTDVRVTWVRGREMTQRELELLEGTDMLKPVDFHSWRRAFSQALADADVNAQQAAALTGHADLGAHVRYLRNTTKARTVPEGALPRLSPPGLINVPFQAEPSNDSAVSQLRGLDLNQRPSGYESGNLAETNGNESPERPETVQAETGFPGVLDLNSPGAGLNADRALAADAALGAYLRTRADQIAGRLA